MRYLSLCSGIEAASVAWHPLGWKAVAFSEIEPFPCAVLAHHYPDIPNLGDMTKIDGRKYRGAVDLVVAGTPCQDFSIAGKRAGLAGERSCLALNLVELLHAVQPRWLVWENVPGAFSTNHGRDFGTFVQTLVECGYRCAWRVLDAQFFGVPQRRRRIFLVGHLGDWRHPAAVLFERESLRRHTPQSRKTRQDVAGTLTASLGRSRGGGQDPGSIVTSHWEGGPHPALNQAHGKSGGIGMSNQELFSQRGSGLVPGYCPDIAQAMTCKWAKGTSGPAGDEHHNLVCVPAPIAFGICAQESNSMKSGNPFSGVYQADSSKTLDQNGASPCCNQGGIAVVHPAPEGQAVYPINSQVATRHKALGNKTGFGVGENGDPASTLLKNHSHYVGITSAQSSAVRRLTPRECDRLQGFPDDYTAIYFRGKPAADSPRYKALGNSMAVPVMRWIGERIQKVVEECIK